MKELTLYREDNGQYSTSEARKDDVSGVYVQKEYLTDLQKQNDELRAKLSEIINAHDCKDTHELWKAVRKTQAQSLADIRAEAVIEASDWLLLASDKAPSDSLLESNMMTCVDLLRSHANRIKEG